MSTPYPIEFTYHAMASSGNISGLKMMLEQVGPDHAKNIINCIDHRGFTVLHRAMESGDCDLVRLLIESGADIMAEVTGSDPEGWTALHLAAFDDYPAVIELLVKSGAEVSCYGKGDSKMSPIRVAVTRNHPSCLAKLLDLGADPLDVNSQGFTLLHEAANIGSPEMIKLLCNAGCEADSQANDGSTPLMWAARHADDTIIKLMEDESQ